MIKSEQDASMPNTDERRITMGDNRTYMIGRYRVVEQIEKTKEGYRWGISANDDHTAQDLPWGSPGPAARFNNGGVASNLEEARRYLATATALMRRSLADDMP
jgi:hypothetical protein